MTMMMRKGVVLVKPECHLCQKSRKRNTAQPTLVPVHDQTAKVENWGHYYNYNEERTGSGKMGYMWKHCQLLQDEWENTEFGMDYLNPASNVHGQYRMD